MGLLRNENVVGEVGRRGLGEDGMEYRYGVREISAIINIPYLSFSYKAAGVR